MIQSTDKRPQFEQDLDAFVQVQRPGCKVTEVTCPSFLCDFFGYVAHETAHETAYKNAAPKYCPCCGAEL